MPSEVSLFRHQALEHFIQSREKTVLPRITRPPVFLLLWILLSLATIALMMAWFGRIPVYLSGVGIVMEQTMLPNRQAVSPAMALVFVPVASAHIVSIRVGAPVQLQMGTSEQSYTSAVDGVEPGS